MEDEAGTKETVNGSEVKIQKEEIFTKVVTCRKKNLFFRCEGKPGKKTTILLLRKAKNV